MSPVLLLILILLLFGAVGTAPWLGWYGGGWGPSGGLWLILFVLIILAITGRL